MKRPKYSSLGESKILGKYAKKTSEVKMVHAQNQKDQIPNLANIKYLKESSQLRIFNITIDIPDK